VLDAHRTGVALALRAFPFPHAGIVARLHPGNRLACGVARRGERDGAQPAGLEALGDADEIAVFCLEHALEHRAQRVGVDQALRRRQRRLPAREKTAAPAQRACGQVAQVDAEDMVDADAAPHLGEAFRLLCEGPAAGGEKRGVDAAGRHAGQNVGDGVGDLARQQSQHADLIRGARAPAAEDEGQMRLV
jgi:hypothetical protein